MREFVSLKSSLPNKQQTSICETTIKFDFHYTVDYIIIVIIHRIPTANLDHIV